MKEVTDRVVQYPRRFKLTKVEGTEDEYELTPVPGTVQEAGTPINKELFDSIKTDIESEKTSRESKDTEHDTAITSNSEAISAEAKTRAQADIDLASKITAEEKERKAADIALSDSISDEADAREQAIEAVNTKADNHIKDKNNPHSVTKAQVGLSAVDNVRQYSTENEPPYPVTSVDGKTGAVDLSGTYAKQNGTYSTLISGGNTVVDTRDVNNPPSYYTETRTYYEFKSRSAIGLDDYMSESAFVTLVTKKGYKGDNYAVYQEAVSAGYDLNDIKASKKCYRYGRGSTWGNWKTVFAFDPSTLTPSTDPESGWTKGTTESKLPSAGEYYIYAESTSQSSAPTQVYTGTIVYDGNFGATILLAGVGDGIMPVSVNADTTGFRFRDCTTYDTFGVTAVYFKKK